MMGDVLTEVAEMVLVVGGTVGTEAPNSFERSRKDVGGSLWLDH